MARVQFRAVAHDASPTDSAERTDCDRAGATAYLWLLNAVAAGADWRDATDTVFVIDSDTEKTLVRQIFAAKLARPLDDKCRLPVIAGLVAARCQDVNG